MTPLPIAVFGAGHLGTIHTRLLHNNPRFQVVAVVDPSQAARERIQNEFGLTTAAEPRQLTEKVSAAVIATPTQFHFSTALPLIERGIHLLIEKPITVTVNDANLLNHSATRHNSIIQTGHNERFNQAFVVARQQLPQAKYIEATRTSGYSFRSTDVGVVLDLMIHDLDLIMSMVQSPIRKVDAIGASIIGEHEDLAQARLEFANGCVANLTASRCSFERQRWIRWFSEDGFVSADLDKALVNRISIPTWIKRREHDLNGLPVDHQTRLKERFFTDVLPMNTIQIDPVNAIEAEHNDFFESISQQRVPRVDGWAGQNALAAAHQILDCISSAQGKTSLARAA